MNKEANGTWYISLGMWTLPGLHKWWICVDLDLFYGKAKFDSLCICIGKIFSLSYSPFIESCFNLIQTNFWQLLLHWWDFNETSWGPSVSRVDVHITCFLGLNNFSLGYGPLIKSCIQSLKKWFYGLAPVISIVILWSGSMSQASLTVLSKRSFRLSAPPTHMNDTYSCILFYLWMVSLYFSRWCLNIIEILLTAVSEPLYLHMTWAEVLCNFATISRPICAVL